MAALLLAPVLLALTGCSSWLARQIVTAPGPEKTNYVATAEAWEQFRSTHDLKRMEIPVGPPDAILAATVIEPRNYALEYEFLGYENNTVEIDAAINGPDKAGPPRAPERGTAIVLPGMFQSRFTMVFWGIGLAERGYRVVLADLRGHGESGGEHLTYGIRESRDTLQLIGKLDDRGLLAPPVVLLGTSYGAVTALMAAAADSGQVDAVIAMEPFTDAESTIHHGTRTAAPLLSWALPRRSIERAIDKASRTIGIDIRQARAIDAINRVQAPVLLVHGQEDRWVPPRNSYELYRAANGQTTLMVVPGAGHMDLPMRYDEFSERVFDWLSEALDSPDEAVTSGTREVRPEVSS